MDHKIKYSIYYGLMATIAAELFLVILVHHVFHHLPSQSLEFFVPSGFITFFISSALWYFRIENKEKYNLLRAILTAVIAIVFIHSIVIIIRFFTIPVYANFGEIVSIMFKSLFMFGIFTFPIAILLTIMFFSIRKRKLNKKGHS